MIRILISLLLKNISFAAAQEPPREWTDPVTHHHIIRLSDEPGSARLYFHQNAYTVKGDLMVFTTRDGLSVIDLNTRKIRPLVEGRVGDVVVGRKTRQVFYFKAIRSTQPISIPRDTRHRYQTELRSGSGLAVNADETLLAGSFVEGPVPQAANPLQPPNSAPQTPSSPAPAPGAVTKHDYRLEPNVTLTPDGKWIVFRSNMFGPTQVFAVEVQKTK